MRYVLDVPATIADEINRLVAAGKYKTPQDFILLGIQNQVYLESQSTELEYVPSQSSNVSNVRPKPSVEFLDTDEFLSMNIDGVKTIELGELKRQDILWGQYNRFLPVKIVVRVVANLLRRNASEYVLLSEVHEVAAATARRLGKETARNDKLLGHKRGTIISAGLPMSKEDKSASRFKYQFVGYATADKVEGAAPVLKFLDITKKEGTVLLGITDYGLKFASFSNPVIDNHDYSSPLSEDEVSFLLNHIALQVPGEARLIHFILDKVAKGRKTPEALNDSIRAEYGAVWKGKNEQATMRSGAVSRMSELGLLKREKDGVKVTYLLTERGQQYLNRLKETGAPKVEIKQWL
ncbi:MAG: hypothetical protein WB643_14080 [Candidatus Bathyarchaeia archaeon]